MIFLISVVLAVGLVADASADPNLIAYWSFDNSGDPGHDDSGNGRDLTLQGAAAYTAGGKLGGAITLPGQDSAYLEDDDGEDYINGLDAITVAMWIKSDEINSDRGFLTTRDPLGLDPKQCLGLRYDAVGDTQNEVIRFYVMTTEDKGLYESPGEVQTTEWQHVTITWSAASGRSELYLDGELQALSRRETESGAGEPLGGTLDNAALVRIGIGYKNLGWKGLVDEVSIYNKALSEDEVLNLFDPGIAWNASPPHLAENVCPDVVLSWSPGENAASHDVYFGTGLSDVNEAATAVKELHDTNSYPVSVELGKTYYWRIDEVNGVNTWTGKIWQFTTNDGNAFDPYPADEQTAVPLDPTLSWIPGCLAASHDVYLGTDWDEVDNANSTNHPNVDYNYVDVNSYDACTPDHLTYYYWRIDEVNGPNTWKGKVWSFRSKTAVFDPNLLVWYKFDETEGNPQDSSGHKFHGAGEDFDEDTWDPCDGRSYPGCINMDSDQRIDLPGLVLDQIGTEITISVWWKEAWRIGDDSWFCGFGDNDIHMAVRAPDSLGEGIQWHAGNDTNDILIWQTDPSAWKDDWHHLVFTKNEGEGIMKIYFDASVVASSNDADPGTLAEAATRAKSGNGIRIGAQWDNSDDFVGKADDFRLYACALSDTQIQALFMGGDVELAWAPSPYNGQIDIPYDVELTWRPGNYASSHDVYLGTSWDDVSDANRANYSNVDHNNVDVNSYDPGLLVLGQSYYWRVDEVNGPNTWRGNIWKFRVANFITIDNFDDDTAQDPPTNDWYNGIVLGTGAGITLRTTPPVIGEHSMRYYYTNFMDWGPPYNMGYYSETQTISLEPNDWNYYDIRVISLWFYGQSGNDATEDATQMNLGQEDDSNYAVVKYGDLPGEEITDIQIEEWQNWEIATSRFTNINFSDVKKICIGFGTRGWPMTAGGGTVYFDEINLYPPTCRSDVNPLEGDFNGDCTVYWEDVEIMADEWLKADVNLGPVQPPNNVNLVGWWRLDEPDNSIATDYAGYDNNGVIETVDVNVWWVAAGHDGNALEFDGGRVRVPDAQVLRPADQVSVCAWINYSEGQNSARVVVKGADNKETFVLEASDNDELVFYVRDGNDYDAGDDSYERYAAESDDDELNRDEWNHIAGTFDGNSVKCYINGELKSTNNDANAVVFLCQDTNDLAIGNRSDDDDRGFVGTIDDVRVYDYGLSAEEIAYITTDETGIFAVQSVANLHKDTLGNDSVNLKDFAKLARTWLEVKLWPE
jgi:hypothetical protein